ncbi:MAG: hypothetical protein ABL883_10755 [Terricaulis sp.]
MISSDPALLMRVMVAAAMAAVILGLVALATSTNAGKRLAGAATVMLGAVLALAALHAPQIFISAATAVSFGYAALGALVLIRLQEAYGDTELAAIDAADDDAERVGTES